MQKLQWMFELIDRISGPTSKIDKSLAALNNGLKATDVGTRTVNGQTRLFDKTTGRFLAMGKSAGAAGEEVGLLGKLGGFAGAGLASVGGAILSVGAAALAAGGALAVGGAHFAIHFLTFKEDSIAAFKAMTGSEQAAHRIFDQAVKFASVTPFKESEVVAMAQSLATRGFKETELPDLMKGVGDVGALLGNEKMESVINALGKIRANGKMTGESLQMLADAGINAQLVFASLEKQTGKTRQQVMQMMAAGQITDPMGIKAAMDAVANGLSGGKLGGAMDVKSRTMTGLMSTLQGRPEVLLAHANLEGFIEPVKATMKQLIDALSPDSENGKRLIALIELVGNSVGKMLATFNSGRDLSTTLGGVLNVVEPLTKGLLAFGSGAMTGFMALMKPLGDLMVEIGKDPDGVEKFTKAMERLGYAVGITAAVIVEGLGALLGVPLFVLTELSDLFDKVSDMFEASGEDLVGGLIDGIISMMVPLAGTMTSLANVLIDTFSDELEINSPSRVFAELGKFTGLGFLEGLADTGMQAVLGGAMQPAQTGMQAATAAAIPGGATQGNTVQFGDIVINVEVDGETAKDGQALGDKVAATLKARLASELGKLGL